jgi:hypothetical protein
MSGLLNLKSVFSPTNTKFQENQSDLTTFDSKFDNGLNIPIQSNLLNLDSMFDDGLDNPILSNLLDSSFDTRFDDGIKSSTQTYIQNQPQDKFDTKFNYNQTTLIEQTYGSGVNINRDNYTLDSLLRGRVYDPIQFSYNFTNETLFVSPEKYPFESSPFVTDSFDPRAPFAKEGTLYFNTDFTLNGNSFMSTNNLDLNNGFFIQNNPQDKFDTKFDYITQSQINTTFATPGLTPTSHPFVPGNPIQMSVSSLDNALRGPVYEQIRFSPDSSITENRQFVNDINDSTGNHPFRTESFDPRAGLGELIKDRTIYQNINNSFNPATKNPEVTFGTAGIQSPYSGGDIFNSVHGGNYGAGGVDLESLGVSFYNGADSDKNLSWESLYNSNHTPKDNPKWQGGNLEALNYGSIVNRDTLDINYNVGGDGEKSAPMYGEKSGLVGAFSRRSEKGVGEPYIVSDIGDDSKTRGGRFTPNRRANADGDRILQFLSSGEGVSFIARQNSNSIIENTVVRNNAGDGLKRVPQRFGVTYNPLSTIAAQETRLLGQGPNIYIKKQGAEVVSNLLSSSIIKKNIRGSGGKLLQKISGFLLPAEYGKDATLDGFAINNTFAGGISSKSGGLLGQISNFGKKLLKSAKAGEFGATEVRKVSKGDKMTLADMVSGDDLNKLETKSTTGVKRKTNSKTAVGVDIENAKNGMPFYFKDLRDNTYLFFRAFIEGLTENISPSYAPHNYVGRSEPVWTYERAEREISMTLKLFAHTSDELTKIYEKMDRLTSLCYPKYINEGEDGYGNRMKPPLTKFRYGELFGKSNNELMGYIKSLSYTVDQSSPYETDAGRRVPKFVIATIGYQVIHDKAPRLGTKFYGINQ